MAWNSHILAVIVFVDSVLGCTVKQFNNGSSTEQFEFSTTFNKGIELIMYQVVYKVNDTYGEPKITVKIFNNSIVGTVSHTNDTTITGNIANGNFSFILNDVAMDKAGVYELVGKSNSVLSCKGLYILGKPTTPSLSVSSAPEEGGETTFNCSSSSSTMPADHGLHFRYTWVIGNQTNPPGGHKFIYHDNTLRITDIQRNQQGQPVICKVTENVTGGFTSDESSQQSIDVKYGPDTVTLSPPYESFTVNETGYLQSINCYAECYPDCTYIWTKKYQNGAVTTSRTLLLGDNIKREDAGVYTCTATNPDRNRDQSLSKDVSIQVNYGPDEVILQPQNQSYAVNKGELLTDIHCSADCYPGCNIKWLKDGNFHLQQSVLSFIPLEKKEAGNYTCVATNTQKQETAEKTVTVNVRYGPESIYFEPAVASPLVIIEDDFQKPITCFSECYPGCTAAWNTTKATGATLSLGYVKRSDTGTYGCKSSNYATEYQKEMNKGLKIIVHYHPDVNVSALNGTYVTAGGDNVVLQCSAEGDPEANISKWIHFAPDGNTTVQEYNSTSFVDGKAYLILNKTSYMDSGYYQCHAANGIPDNITGTIEATNMTEQVLGAKPVVVDSVTDISSATKDNASLWIRYYSNNEMISVAWYRIKNGTKQIVSKNDSKYMIENSNLAVNVTFYNVRVIQPGNTTLLLIQNVDDNDFGMYDAEIRNSVNTTVWRIRLAPQGPPDMPIQFTVIQGSVTPTSVLLSWISGFHGGADQTFYIQFKSLTSAWLNKTSVDGFQKKDAAFNVTADELIPATQYSFRLFSANKFNRSEFSAVVNVTTKTEESQNEDASLIGPGIGGGVGAALLIVALVALIIFLRRRNLTGRSTGQKSLLNESSRQKEAMNDDLAEVQNPMYESAGPCTNSSTNTDAYAKVDKTKKQDYLTSGSKGDVYSQVQKLHKSGTATIGNEKEQTADLYAMPVKAKVNQVHQKKEKKLKQEKKDKPGKKKGRLHGHVNEAMVYENSEEFRTRATDSDNAYELTCTGPQLPSRTKNPDGLIYVEVDHPGRNDKKDNSPIVIHGIDDRNDYAEIAFGKVGTPAPDSDDEQKFKDDAKETETL